MAPRTEAAVRGDAVHTDPAARVRDVLRQGRGTPRALRTSLSMGRTLTPRPWTKARIIIAHERRLEHERDNARTVLTADLGREGVITSPDPSDAAHLVRDEMGCLLPAEEVKNAQPRRYPRSCCCCVTPDGLRGVPHDSSFDWLYEAQRRLSGVAGIEYTPGNTQAAVLARLEASHPDIRLRDILHKHTRRSMTN